MKDFVVYTLPGLLSASKRTEYRQKCREQAHHLLRFLVDNKLTESVLPSSAMDDLVIMASDLTQDGLAVMREGLRKWVAAQDRGGLASDLKILNEALLKVRSSQSQ
jgi:hypothetical protein